MADKDSVAWLFCQILFIAIWLLGLALAWVYYVAYSDTADSTHELAEAGAALYLVTFLGLLRCCKECCFDQHTTNDNPDQCTQCCTACVLLVAFIGGFVLPLISAILMTVGALRSSDTGAKAIAGMTAACAYASLPVSCYIWCRGILCDSED